MRNGAFGKDIGRALYGDGLTELWAAALFLAMAAVWDVGGALVPALAVIAVFGWPVLDRVRRRIVEPRIGHATPADEEPKALGSGMAITTVAVIGGALFVAWWVGDLGLVRVWVAGIAGALVAAGTWYLAGRSNLTRHRILSMASIMWGFAVSVTWGDRGYDSLPIFFVGLAAAFGITGAVALIAFLRANPRVDA